MNIMKGKLKTFQSHLTLEERNCILLGIQKGCSQVEIAREIGKDNSTIGKEIKKHRLLKYTTRLPRECSNYRKCRFERHCTDNCPDFVQFKCKRRDHSPGACNGCSNVSRCRFDKFYYDPNVADSNYRDTLVESRCGINLTDEELKNITDVVAPLLKRGQSPYVIVSNHPELGICEKTLYNYIESRVFKKYSDVSLFDLHRKIRRKPAKTKETKLKKRENRKYLQNRTYEDYLAFIEQHPDSHVVQMDTVYNDGSNGPFMQTFKLMDIGLMIAVLQKEKTAVAMTAGINMLENLLGSEMFKEHFTVILTDRGSEFSAADDMESSKDGSKRTHVFYCDPMCADQKGSLENNHELLRYICPKEVDLFKLGLTNQDKMNLVISHINSMPVEKYGGKSPLDMTEFMYPALYEKIASFGIIKVERDKIILKPYLLHI